MLPGMSAANAHEPTIGPAPVSVQLYSLREEAATDFPGVIARLGAAGFVGVELAGFHGLDPADFARMATEAGLVVSSGHLGDVTPDALNRALDDLQTVGCATAVLAFLPPEVFATADAIGRSADALNTAHGIAKSRGVALGYHNHFWEFQQRIDDSTAWAVFLDQVDQEVFVELDTYWSAVGGADPVAVIDALCDRLRLLHVKDGPADDPKNPMVAVGSGSMDIAAILRSASGAQWHIVELDRCATDMFTAVEDSYRFLTGAGLSRGRR
jgi:sugar phosphate isomerase/epimerase